MNGQECHCWRSCALGKEGCKGIGEMWEIRRQSLEGDGL